MVVSFSFLQHDGRRCGKYQSKQWNRLWLRWTWNHDVTNVRQELIFLVCLFNFQNGWTKTTLDNFFRRGPKITTTETHSESNSQHWTSKITKNNHPGNPLLQDSSQTRAPNCNTVRPNCPAHVIQCQAKDYHSLSDDKRIRRLLLLRNTNSSANLFFCRKNRVRKVQSTWCRSGDRTNNPQFTPGALAHTHDVTHAVYVG